VSRTVFGVLIATVVLYMWGFVYWGASSAPYVAWHQAPDDRVAGAALLEHFPESGVYYLPGNDHETEVRNQLFEQGPTGFVILDRDGRPAFDTNIMIAGFVLNAIVVSVLALLLRITLPAAPSYRQRLRIVTTAGAAGVLLINFGDVVWWAIPMGWVAVQAAYNFVGVVIAGAILARFIQPEATASA
jgi:hypothetical protein